MRRILILAFVMISLAKPASAAFPWKSVPWKSLAAFAAVDAACAAVDRNANQKALADARSADKKALADMKHQLEHMEADLRQVRAENERLQKELTAIKAKKAN